MERFLIAIPLLFYEYYTPLYVSDVVALQGVRKKSIEFEHDSEYKVVACV